MMSISSVPNSHSPACGMSAATAIRGRSMPALRIMASDSGWSPWMAGPVIWSSACRSETWEVTRDIHWFLQHVHLAEIAAVPKQVGEHLVLVGKTPAAVEHGSLVERREGDGVHLAGLGEVNGAGQRFAGDAAGLGADHPAVERRIGVLRSTRGMAGSDQSASAGLATRV
jgi:hypothetical protein